MAEKKQPYDVIFTDTALKNLRRYPQKDRQRILARIEQLAKELLSDEEKLADYLDYLHMQAVKANTKKRFDLEEVKQMLALE